jgi:hypothetical protein
MKTTVVPAQITTVEDKIAGNLSFTQLLLMTTPIFMSGAIFVFAPPFLHLQSYKIVICVMLTAICLTLAIRIKGKIVLLWMSIIGRYNIRPRYYVYNKNDAYLRNDTLTTEEELPAKILMQPEPMAVIKRDVPLRELIRLETAVADPRAKFHFKTTKKGGLRVYIQEIK